MGFCVASTRNGSPRLKDPSPILEWGVCMASRRGKRAPLKARRDPHSPLADETFKLEEPFLVLATQNPIEQEGTY
ncbi:AAA family ATPase, partial [uncultured Fibrobacter sp.]|uniref:AAA family ATPase n=1 Tax=uncultured Fibrobacter sp. TaxID=261512 RepID=UPI00345D1776